MRGGKTKRKKAEAKNHTEKKAFPAIGIGASAGGLEALETFSPTFPQTPAWPF